MEMVLIARETVVKFFKRFEVFFLPILKFFLGLYVFSRILNVGHIHEVFETFSEAMPTSMLTWLFAVLFVVMPANLTWVLIIFTVTIQFSASVEVAAFVFVILFLIFLFYGRMAARESFFILFVILAFVFNVPYLVPLILGLYFPVTAIIPVIIGVFLSMQIPVAFSLIETPMVIDIGEMEMTDLVTELPEIFSEAYTTVMSAVLGDVTWVFIAVILAMVTIVVYLVSRQSIDYAREIAIGLGCAMTIFGFILLSVTTDAEISIMSMILWVIVSGILAIIVRLFDSVLDYQRAESVQFEDDNNFYHVKIVPKVIMTKPKRVVKRIRPTAGPPDESE